MAGLSKSGRYAFAKYSVMINVAVKINEFVPRFIFIFAWNLFRPWAFKVAIVVRYFIAKRLAKSCGDVVQFGPNVTVKCWDRLELGSRVNIHENCYIDASGGVKIGSDVSIAHASSVLSFDHTWKDQGLPIKYNPLEHQPVVISDDVWIGCGVRVLAGSCISARVVIAAGAVLTEGEYNAGVYGGVPARKIKGID